MNLICVYGAVNDKIDESYKQAGIELEKMIAKRNYGLVYSGMKSGISRLVLHISKKSKKMKVALENYFIRKYKIKMEN